MGVQWKKEKNKMAKFDYKKWITENKYGKNPFNKLYEQGVADFEVKEQTTGSNSSNTGSGTTGSNTGSGTTGSTTGSNTGSQDYYCVADSNSPTLQSCIQSATVPYAVMSGPHSDCSSCAGGLQNQTTGSNYNSCCDWCNDYGPGGPLAGTASDPSGIFDSNMGQCMDWMCTDPNYCGGGTAASASIATTTAIQGGPYPGNFDPQSWFERFKSKLGGFKREERKCKYLNGLIQTWTVKMDSETTGPATDNALLAKIQLVEQLMNEYGCDDMREMNTFMKESKIIKNKKITKKSLKNIIKEELKKSLIKEQWSGEGCASYLATSDPKCVKCASSQPTPYIPPSFGASDTGPQCQCCDDERTTGGEIIRGCMDSNATNFGQCCPGNPPGCTPNTHHQECCEGIVIRNEDPCSDRNTAHEECYWCKGEGNTSGLCEPVGGNLAYALGAAIPLFQNITDCHTNTECGPGEPIDDCEKCCCEKDIMPSEQLRGLEIPTSDPEPMPGGCIPNTQTQLSPTANPCKCPPGTMEIPCKPGPGIPTWPNDGIAESKKLRNTIYKELFGK